jgi:hypothetical protein
MSREEAAAKAAYGRDHREAPYASIWEDTSEMLRADYVATEAAALSAADAHDRANGIHHLTLDDATVERAAFELYKDDHWGQPTEWPTGPFADELTLDEFKADYIKLARAVLAAAVKEEQA